MANRLIWYDEFLKKENDFNESFEEFSNTQNETENFEIYLGAISESFKKDTDIFNERDALQKEIEDSGFGTRERLGQASDANLEKAKKKYDRLGELLGRMQEIYQAYTKIMKK